MRLVISAKRKRAILVYKQHTEVEEWRSAEEDCRMAQCRLVNEGRVAMRKCGTKS